MLRCASDIMLVVPTSELYWFYLPCVCFLSVFLRRVLAIKNNLPVYLMIHETTVLILIPEPIAQMLVYHVLCMLSQVTTRGGVLQDVLGLEDTF